MKENKLLNILSLGFIISHFIIITGIIYFRFTGWYNTETVKICLPVVSPIFVTYVTIMVTYFIKNQTIIIGGPNNDSVPFLYALVTLLTPTIIISVMMSILYYQGINPMAKDDLTFFLGCGEAFFGVFLGLIFNSIFGMASPSEEPQTKSKITNTGKSQKNSSRKG